MPGKRGECIAPERRVEGDPACDVAQRCRVADWPEGFYSHVRLELDGNGDTTHLDGGWHKMYWEPLNNHCSR